MPIESITLYRLRLPLAVPYKLALGVVRAFDTIIARVDGGDGAPGLGEATILTGYTDETIAGAWRAASDMAAAVAGMETAAAKDRIAAYVRAAPFAATALMSAIEMLDGHPALGLSEPARVPILAIVNAMDEGAIAAEVEARLAEGYGTLKVKVGFDAGADLARVGFIQRLIAGRALMRIDGNQGYGVDDAMDFAAALDPAGIELFEQPCAAGDWTAAARVARVSTVPMMLDESIYGMDDIDRAAETGAARFVKLKLMKAGGLDRLIAGLGRIRALGMTPVLGNGVAGEVGCWMEACVARGTIDNAGEMNGLLKPVSGLLERPIPVAGGAMVLEPGAPRLDAGAVARAALETTIFPKA